MKIDRLATDIVLREIRKRVTLLELRSSRCSTLSDCDITLRLSLLEELDPQAMTIMATAASPKIFLVFKSLIIFYSQM